MSETNLREARVYLDSIDFSPIVERLHKDKRWHEKKALKAIEDYKKFLLLQKKYEGKQTFVPSLKIDEVWHSHILFTKQYHEDCQNLFGRYLHHQPETEKGKYTLNKAANEKAADETERLYFEEYGEYIYGKPIYYPVILEPFVKLFFYLKSVRVFA